MSWRDTLQPASFRGVQFYVESHDTTVGRRNVLHEYPGRDVPAVEDLGRAARKVSVTAYVLGAEYHLQRDALLAAIEQGGPGELVHPYLGRMTASAEPAAFRESKDDGGYCAISLVFVESGEQQFPAATYDRRSAMELAADEAAAAAEYEFHTSRFRMDGQPQFARDSVADKIRALNTKLRAIAGKVLPSGELGGYFRTLRDTAAAVEELMDAPEQLAGELRQNIMVLGGVSQSGLASVRRVLELFGFGDDDAAIAQNTSTRVRQADNLWATNMLVRTAGVAAAVSAARVVSLSSANEAATLRAELLDAIDGLLVDASDAEYQALIALRAQAVNSLPDADDLPLLMAYETTGSENALAIAWNLYGDAERAGEVAAQNNARHPGFLRGTLQVLSDG